MSTRATIPVMADVRCDKCGKVLKVGDWPYCPHPVAVGQMGMLGEYHARFDEHMIPGGAHITSYAEHKRLMKKHNLVERGRKRGMPGQEV